MEEVEEGRVVHGGRGRRHGDAKGIGGKAVGEGDPSSIAQCYRFEYLFDILLVHISLVPF